MLDDCFLNKLKLNRAIVQKITLTVDRDNSICLTQVKYQIGISKFRKPSNLARTRWGLVSLVFFIIQISVSTMVKAGTFIVDSSTQGCTLAIQSANTNTNDELCIESNVEITDVHTIELQIDIVFSDHHLLEEDSALPAVTSNIIINGNGHSLIRDESSEVPFRFFRVERAVLTDSPNLTLNNLTLTGGLLEITPLRPDKSRGAAILVRHGDLRLDRVTLSNNVIHISDRSHRNGAHGGGIYIENSDVQILNSQIIHNRCTSESAESGSCLGAGVFAVGVSSEIDIENTTISGNSAHQRAALGGGVFAEDILSISISNSTLSGNSATSCGGLYVNRVIGGTLSVNINSTTITENTATSGSGGGMCLFDLVLNMTNSILAGNSSSGPDGGSEYEFYGDSELVISSFRNNLVGHSGITYYQAVGIINFDPVNLPDVNLITDSSNINASSSDDGFSTHRPTPMASILRPLDDNTCLVPMGTTTGGACPMTHGLAARSPAIDSGSLDFCPNYDQRGESRSDGLCDMGSFEGYIDDEQCYVIRAQNRKVVMFCL